MRIIKHIQNLKYKNQRTLIVIRFKNIVKIVLTGEPRGLPSRGSHRVGHD